jgi:hypothetical protein
VKDFRDFLGPGLESGKTLVGYKDVLAHLDGTEEDEIRLRYAEALDLSNLTPAAPTCSCI